VSLLFINFDHVTCI